MEKIIDRILKHILQYHGSRFRVNFYLKDLQRMFTMCAEGRAAKRCARRSRSICHSPVARARQVRHLKAVRSSTSKNKKLMVVLKLSKMSFAIYRHQAKIFIDDIGTASIAIYR
jgi:hypothetical protein